MPQVSCGATPAPRSRFGLVCRTTQAAELDQRKPDFPVVFSEKCRFYSAFRIQKHSALLLTVSDPGLIRCQIWGFLESSNSARDPGHFRTGHRMVFLGDGNRVAISLLGRLSSGLLSILIASQFPSRPSFPPYELAPHSGLGCKGPERIFKGPRR
jgi:hypothetical protein